MKANLTLLFILIIGTVSFTQAQSKKELEANYATCVSARDSLQRILTGLSEEHTSLIYEHDSVNQVCIMLDSLKIRLESKVSEIRKTLNDSIAALNKENFALKTSLEILKAEFVNRTYVIKDLQQLKELLDDQIITQQEFEAKKARLLEKL